MRSEDYVTCPYCEYEVPDCTNGEDPGPWWNGEDDNFEVKCFSCKKNFALETCWHPRFETFKMEDYEDCEDRP